MDDQVARAEVLGTGVPAQEHPTHDWRPPPPRCHGSRLSAGFPHPGVVSELRAFVRCKWHWSARAHLARL